MLELRDRIAAMELALQTMEEKEIPSGNRSPARRGTDPRPEKISHSVRTATAPPPAQDEKAHAIEDLTTVDYVPEDAQHYASIAEKYGLGHLEQENFIEYTIYNAFVTNLRVCPVHEGQGRFYYIEHRSFLPHVPGAILREGVQKEGRCLGAAHIPLAGKNRFGIGDYDKNPDKMTWEILACTGFWTHMKYAFTHETPSGERKTFHWMRSSYNYLLDDQGDFVLVEEGVHNEHLVLAIYTGKGVLKWKKRGRLRIRPMEQFGESWEKVVVLTWASIIELCRRRARIRRYSPSHFIGM